MPTTQELLDALRRIEHAPNQGDRGEMGKLADAAYKMDGRISSLGMGQPNVVGNVISSISGMPSLAATADNISRGLPVDNMQAVETALAPLGIYQLGGYAGKGAKGIVNALRK